MSKSTPDDLVVTFRSLARRQREAIGDADPGTVGGALGELQRHVEAAARLLGVRPDAAAVAEEIVDAFLAGGPDGTETANIASLPA